MADLKKYRVTGEVTISVSVVVEAGSVREAKRLALEAPMMSLCHQCASGDADAWSTSGELDGEVSKITEVYEETDG